jgi:putative transposase
VSYYAKPVSIIMVLVRSKPVIIYEFKVKGKDRQYRAIDDAIRTSQFIQNKCLYQFDMRTHKTVE